VFDKFPTYHMKIQLGDFNAKVGREDISKLTIGNESLHKISNDNGVRLVNFATSKNLSQKYDVPTSQHPQIYLDISRWENPHQIDHILVDR
jgi:hypothetical protein